VLHGSLIPVVARARADSAVVPARHQPARAGDRLHQLEGELTRLGFLQHIVVMIGLLCVNPGDRHAPDLRRVRTYLGFSVRRQQVIDHFHREAGAHPKQEVTDHVLRTVGIDVEPDDGINRRLKLAVQ
jgi:hypothetical protein